MGAMDVGIVRGKYLAALRKIFLREVPSLRYLGPYSHQIEADGDESLARFRELARGDVEEP